MKLFQHLCIERKRERVKRKTVDDERADGQVDDDANHNFFVEISFKQQINYFELKLIRTMFGEHSGMTI